MKVNGREAIKIEQFIKENSNGSKSDFMVEKEIVNKFPSAVVPIGNIENVIFEDRINDVLSSNIGYLFKTRKTQTPKRINDASIKQVIADEVIKKIQKGEIVILVNYVKDKCNQYDMKDNYNVVACYVRNKIAKHDNIKKRTIKDSGQGRPKMEYALSFDTKEKKREKKKTILDSILSFFK